MVGFLSFFKSFTRTTIKIPLNYFCDVYVCKGQKVKTFICSPRICCVSAGLNKTRQKDSVKFNTKINIFYQKSNQSTTKSEKPRKMVDFIKIFFLLNITSRHFCFGRMETTFYYEILFFICNNNRPTQQK